MGRHDGSPGKGTSTIVKLPMIGNRSGHNLAAGGHHDQNHEDITKAEKKLKAIGCSSTSGALPIVAPVAVR
jgi:hypothetical protein